MENDLTSGMQKNGDSEREKTIQRPDEIDRVVEDFELVIAERVLVLEPLLKKREWFDEENPKVITLSDLEGVSNNPELIKRFYDAVEMFPKDPKKVNERLNPFRANTMTALLGSTLHTFRGSGDQVGEKYIDHAEEKLNIKTGMINAKLDELKGVIAYRKGCGELLDKTQELLERLDGAQEEKILKIKQIEGELRKEMEAKEKEIALAFKLARLATKVIRDYKGEPDQRKDLDALVEEIKSTDIKIDKIDFDKKISEAVK